MKYELVTVIRPADPNWKLQKERLHKEGGKVLSIAPSPDFEKLKKDEKVNGLNIIDRITKRPHDSKSFLFFNQAPVPDEAEIFMNEDRSISVVQDGEEIGEVELYHGTRRHVKNLRYLNWDGTPDYTVEFADDGQPFSNIYYHEDKIQQIDFLGDKELPVLSYYFYDGQINLVALQEPRSFEVKEKFDTVLDFLSTEVAKIVKKTDTVTITYMGQELFALAKTKSHNILRLEESPMDEQGNVKGNLKSILENRIPYIHEVHVNHMHYAQLQKTGVAMGKVKIS